LALQRCQEDASIANYPAVCRPFASCTLAYPYGIGVERANEQAAARLIVAYYTSNKKEGQAAEDSVFSRLLLRSSIAA
jgi:hypothetical protein